MRKAMSRRSGAASKWTDTQTRCSKRHVGFDQCHLLKINHEGLKSPPLSQPTSLRLASGVMMSNRPTQYAEYPQHHAHDHGRPQARRVGPIKAPPPKANQSDYTIAHGGKQVRIGPVVFWI